nr:hypothetical protein [Tanacetum cinerariifolium]
DPVVWRHWLGGRLPQGDREELERPAKPLEIFLAIGVWPGRCDLPLYDCANPGGNHAADPDAQGFQHSVGHRFRRPDLLRDRRLQQRCEPDRWPGRLGDLADGDGRRC